LLSQSHGRSLGNRDQYMKEKGTLSLREDVEDLSHTEMLLVASRGAFFQDCLGLLLRIAEMRGLL
jgi:hypothetical protein